MRENTAARFVLLAALLWFSPGCATDNHQFGIYDVYKSYRFVNHFTSIKHVDILPEPVGAKVDQGMRKCKDSSRQGAAQGNTGNFTAYFPLEERREEEISRHIEMLSDIDASIGQRLSDCPKLIRVELFVDEFKYLYLFCDQKKDYILMSVYSRIDFGWEKVYPN